MRIESPVKGDFRLSRVPTTVGGVDIPAGTHADGAATAPRTAIRAASSIPTSSTSTAPMRASTSRSGTAPTPVPARRSPAPKRASASNASSTACATSGSPKPSTARRTPAATSTRPPTSCAACNGCTWSSARPADRYGSSRSAPRDVRGATHEPRLLHCGVSAEPQGEDSVLRPLASSAVCALVLSFGLAAVAHADAASPTVTGPVTGGNGVPIVFAHTTFDLATVGYTQSEFFLEGKASAYTSDEPLTPDGKWTVTPSSPADYKTRIVVNRPIDDRDFNGTVVVEWLNVTGGADASPDWIHMHNELIRRGLRVGGCVRAGGRAQRTEAAVVPAGPDGAVRGRGSVRVVDASRRQLLLRHLLPSRPGDPRQRRDRSSAGCAPQRLIAVGESQSAGRLTTYINAVHPVVDVYDGFLVHSRRRERCGPLAGTAPAPDRADRPPPRSSVTTSTSRCWSSRPRTTWAASQARQPDSANYRLWEVAGTAHFDHYGLALGWIDMGERESVPRGSTPCCIRPTSRARTSRATSRSTPGRRRSCSARRSTALNRWVDRRHSTTERATLRDGRAAARRQYAVDANGIVLGGIRTPAVDAPVAKLSGFGQTGGRSSAASSARPCPSPRRARRPVPQPRRVRPSLDRPPSTRSGQGSWSPRTPSTSESSAFSRACSRRSSNDASRTSTAPQHSTKVVDLGASAARGAARLEPGVEEASHSPGVTSPQFRG